MTAELRHRLRKLEARMPERQAPLRPGQALERLVAAVAAAQARGECEGAKPDREMACPFPPESARARLWHMVERVRRASSLERAS